MGNLPAYSTTALQGIASFRVVKSAVGPQYSNYFFCGYMVRIYGGCRVRQRLQQRAPIQAPVRFALWTWVPKPELGNQQTLHHFDAITLVFAICSG